MKKEIVIACLLGSALVLLSGAPSFSQQITGTDVSYSVEDSNVVVRCSLNGPVDKSYKVQLVLKRRAMSSFKMVPGTVTGDIGTGMFEGQNRQIIWHLYDDAPYGLDGNDYYFNVTTTLLGAKRGGFPWGWIIGGAVVAGAAAYFVPSVITKSGGGSHLPAPPGRP